MPFAPPMNMSCIDVRDVATAHIKAMTIPEAAGQRHLVAYTNLDGPDMAKVCYSYQCNDNYSQQKHMEFIETEPKPFFANITLSM